MLEWLQSLKLAPLEGLPADVPPMLIYAGAAGTVGLCVLLLVALGRSRAV
jgi:hypothetical protein